LLFLNVDRALDFKIVHKRCGKWEGMRSGEWKRLKRTIKVVKKFDNKKEEFSIKIYFYYPVLIITQNKLSLFLHRFFFFN
jgi:hypothetical protein